MHCKTSISLYNYTPCNSTWMYLILFGHLSLFFHRQWLRKTFNPRNINKIHYFFISHGSKIFAYLVDFVMDPKLFWASFLVSVRSMRFFPDLVWLSGLVWIIGGSFEMIKEKTAFIFHQSRSLDGSVETEKPPQIDLTTTFWVTSFESWQPPLQRIVIPFLAPLAIAKLCLSAQFEYPVL